MYSILADILIVAAGIFSMLYVWYAIGLILDVSGALVYFEKKFAGALYTRLEKVLFVLYALVIIPASALLIITAKSYRAYFDD